MNNLIGIVISYIYIAIVIVMAKLFEKLGKEASRKFIHIMLGNWWIIAMFTFDNFIFAAFVPFTFVIINYISYKGNIIKIMEREKEENEKEGLGTVYYALTLLILSIITFGIIKRPELGLIPVFIMAYGDGLAGIIGKKVKSFKYKIKDTEKSIAGSITMLFISFAIISVYLLNFNNELWLIKSIIISIICTLLEAISIKGTDNLTVPIATLIMLLVI